MIKTTLFRLQKTFLFSLTLIPVLFTACNAFDEPATEFFDKYAKIAYFKSIEKSRTGLGAAGYTQIDGTDDFTLTYNIVNPEKFELTSEVTFPEGSLADGNYELGGDDVNTITLTFRASFLAGVDGTDLTSDISPTLKIFRKSDGYAQCYDTQKIKCNSQPDPITRAFSYMYSSGGTPAVNQRQVIAFDLPSSLKADVNLLTVSANGQTHYFDVVAGIPKSRNNDTWTVGDSAPALNSTITGGSIESTDYYIITDIDNLTSLDVFDVVLTLSDTGGLSSECRIPSKLLKLAGPTFTLVSPDPANPGFNSYDKPYLVYTINNPESNPSDATLHFIVMDSASNIIKDIDGNESEHTGTATFHLYPKNNGGQETYTITDVRAERDGWVTSETASDSQTIEGKTLTLKSNVDVDSATGDRIVNLGESYTLTSQDVGIITVDSITKTGGGSIVISPNSGKGSFTYTFASPGTYTITSSVSADYYGSVNIFPETVKVVDNTGGGITTTLPKNVTFSYDNDGRKITASDDDGPIADASLTDWSIELYYEAVSTGYINTTNTDVKIPDSYPAGNYILKIKVKYEENVYSGEVGYTKS